MFGSFLATPVSGATVAVAWLPEIGNLFLMVVFVPWFVTALVSTGKSVFATGLSGESNCLCTGVNAYSIPNWERSNWIRVSEVKTVDRKPARIVLAEYPPDGHPLLITVRFAGLFTWIVLVRACLRPTDEYCVKPSEQPTLAHTR